VNIRTFLSMALIGAVFLGCAPASSSPAPDGDDVPERNSTVAQLFARVGPEGEVDTQLAVDAFSYMIAPLPGANHVDGEPPADWERKSGTFAYNWLGQHVNDLTPEQLAAVESHLAPGPKDTVILSTDPEPSAMAMVGGSLIAADSSRHARYVRILKEAEAGFAQKVGENLRRPWALIVRDASGGQALAATRLVAIPTIGPFGLNPVVGCSFETYTQTDALDETSLRTTLAHEMWHCFQGQMGGFRPTPPWLIEGQAEWAGEALMGPSEAGVPYFRAYVTTPSTSLFERDYDATGFYWQLAEHGISPWTHAKAMLSSVTNSGIFDASGAKDDTFLQDWAPQLLRDGAIGPEINWLTKGIFNVGERGRRTPITVAVAATTPVSAAAVTNTPYDVTAAAPVVKSILGQGNGLIGAPGYGTVDARNALLCTDPEGCQCPPNYVWKGPLPVAMAAKFFLGVTGGPDGASGTLEGFRVMDFCEKKDDEPDVPPLPGNEQPQPGNGQPGPTSADSCTSGCPMSNGDVHIVPIEGQSYDFQAVGEFVLFRSADGSFEIQGRQEPYTGSDHVSVNTAVAMRVADRRIAVYGDPANSDRLVVMVDGAIVDPMAGPVTVNDAVITHVDAKFAGYEVRFADGTRVSLAGQLEYGINLVINPSDRIRDGVVGLMGPIPPASMGVPALPDGTVLTLQIGRDDYNEKLYGIFEDSWRVSADTSLFDYTDAKTTESYINPDFPAPERVQTLADLTPEQVAAGEAACSSVVIEMLHAQCVYDVAVTGVNAFGDLYDLSAEIVDRGTIVPGGQAVRIANLFWDPTTGAVPLDVYAWTDAGAALVTTVKYGEVTEFFDPGMRTQATFGGDVLVSLQPAGEPVQEEAFNLSELRMEIEPGLERTYVVGTGAPDPFFGNQVRPTTVYFDEAGGSFPLAEPDAGRSLLFLTVNALVHTHDPIDFYISAGDGCLTQPGFAGLAQTSGVGDNSWGYEGPLEVIPDDNLELTLHQVPAGDDPFTQKCDGPPIAGPWPLALAAGQRAHLILYSIPGDPTIRSLILPFGDS